jgi:serine/threonine protein kinase
VSAIRPNLVIYDQRIRFIELLGKGGQAEVWKGVECGTLTHRIVAIKVLCVRLEERASAENAAKIKNLKDAEAALWPLCQDSPHVVQLYYAFETVEAIEDDEYVLLGFVMEFSPLGDLGRRLDAEGLEFSSTMEARQFLLDLAWAVKTGHDVGVIHNDIKPQNVILFPSADGGIRPKLMDFGTSMTEGEPGLAGGTPEYMAPERFEGIVSMKSDVYSLGVLFYEIITRKHFFTAESVRQRECKSDHRHRRAPGQPTLEPIRRRIDDEMANLVEKMLANDPDGRPGLAHIVRAISIAITRSMVDESPTPEHASLLDCDTYRWNSRVHEVMGHRLQYHLIRGRAPQIDIPWLCSNLDEASIRGYSLYRILGGFDYILRTWTSPVTASKLDGLMERFQAVFQGEVRRFLVRDYVGVPAAIPLKLETRDSVLETSYEAAGCDDALEALKRWELATSLLSESGENPVRFFVAVNLSSTGRFHIGACKDSLFRVLDHLEEVKHLSMYVGDGDLQILIKFRLVSFLDYRGVFEKLLEASAGMIGLNVTFQSFVELDQRGYLESDDGPLQEELSEHARLCHPGERQPA